MTYLFSELLQRLLARKVRRIDMVVVAHDKDLFQVRLTAPSAWYSYYNHVYRQLRSSFKFL